MTKTVLTIIDYGAGNIKSLTNTLDRVGVAWKVTSDTKEVAAASKIIMPGVGSAQAAMKELRKRGLVEVIQNTHAPFLGICLGMQVLFESSEEGDTECLGIIKGRVKKLDKRQVKVPQVGYNQIKKSDIIETPLFSSFLEGGSKGGNGYFYFVHSYYCVPTDQEVITTTTEYGITFASAVQYNNFYGVQFHPEKSGEAGRELLARFCSL